MMGSRIIVWDVEEASRLYKEGFYGRYIGVPKPKELELKRPIELSPVEALYLMEKGRLKIYDEEGKELDLRTFREWARGIYDMFDEVYEVYKDLRSRGYVVRPGLKFGTTFAVYKYGPGIDHAPFLVHVMPYESKLDPIEIIRAGRLSHSVRKKFIIAVVSPQNKEVKYYMFRWFKA